MGNNNVSLFLCLRWSVPVQAHIRLGTNATNNMKTISRRTGDGLHVENAEVLDTVEGSKCKLETGRIIYDVDVNVLTFRLQDIYSGKGKLSLVIFKQGTGLFNMDEWRGCFSEWTKTRRSVDAWGGVTDTKVYLYGTANRCGLLVLLCKKGYYRERYAKAATIAHYFASSNSSSETTDIGYSVVTKVGLCDGMYDIPVEGPQSHHVSAFLFMIDEVSRNGFWKPTICPRCRIIRIVLRRMQSESDDNDGGRRQNAVTIVNSGSSQGPGCGACVVRNSIVIN